VLADPEAQRQSQMRRNPTCQTPQPTPNNPGPCPDRHGVERSVTQHDASADKGYDAHNTSDQF